MATGKTGRGKNAKAASGTQGKTKAAQHKKKTPTTAAARKKTSARTASEMHKKTRAVAPLSPRKGKRKKKTTPQRTGEGKMTGKGREEILRKQLILQREGIVREAKSEIAKYIKGETRQIVESVLDDGDWSVIDLSEDINLRRLAAHREVLLKIDEALRKLKEGTYGTCEDCGEEINTARLKVLPFAIYCRDCQEKREELEKIATEEHL